MRMSSVTRKSFRNEVLLFCLMLLLTVVFSNGDARAEDKAFPAKQVTEETVVVEVNGVKLTQKEVDEKIDRTLASVQGMVPPEQMGQFKENIQGKLVEDFIARTLLNEEIEKNKIVVDDSEVTKALGEVEAKVPPGMTLEEMLKQGGITMEEMKENISFSLRANKLFASQIKSDYTPSEADIQKYYTDNKKKYDKPETIHARHILIKVDEKDEEKVKLEKKAKIEALRKQIIEGADFEEVAKANSDCPSKDRGGDLGTFPRGRMVKPFEDAAFTQKVNEVGPVIETKFGYHIIQVVEHNQANQQSMDEVKVTITETLQNQKKQEMATTYMDGLKGKAKIVYPSTDSSKK